MECEVGGSRVKGLDDEDDAVAAETDNEAKEGGEVGVVLVGWSE